MTSRKKLVAAIRNNPKGVRFVDACKVAEGLVSFAKVERVAIAPSRGQASGSASTFRTETGKFLHTKLGN